MNNLTDDQEERGGSPVATSPDSQKITIIEQVDEEDPLPSIVMCDKLYKITGQVRPKHLHGSQSLSAMKMKERDMFELHFSFNEYLWVECACQTDMALETHVPAAFIERLIPPFYKHSPFFSI